MEKELKILLLEDSRSDAEMITRLLARENMNCRIELVMSKPQFIKALDSFAPDIILSDHALPQFNSSVALQLTRQKDPELPFILVTGAASEEFAANIIKQGADDYILKDRIGRLPAAIVAAIKQRSVERENREIQSKIKENEEKYRTLVERVSDGFAALDAQWRFTYVNNIGANILKRDPANLIGKYLWTEFPEEVDKNINKAFRKAMRTQKYSYLEAYFETLGIWMETHFYPSPDGMSIFFKDISGRKESELRLKESEEKYRTLFFKSPLPIWIFDLKSLQILEVNNAAVRNYGYSRKEFLSMNLTDFRPPEDVPKLLKDVSKIKDNVRSRQGVWRHIKKNGEMIVVESSAHPIEFNRLNARMVITNDITHKIKAEKELKLREMRLREAQELARIGNWEIDLLQNTHYWSDELYKIFRLPMNHNSPSTELLLSFIHPKERDMVQKMLTDSLKSFQKTKLVVQFIRKDDKVRFALLEWKFEMGPKGKATRLYGILQDITEVKQAEDNLKILERKIHKQKIQEQKKIARAIITGQEKERNFIGKELHDNINQLLAGSKMYLSIAGKKSEEIKDLISYPMQLIDMSIEEIRALSQKLVTPLRNINLELLIKNLLSDLKKTVAFKTKFDYKLAEENLSDELKINIYRIIQEQTNNIQKYAEAKTVRIAIEEVDKTISMVIEDDGKGFDTSVRSKGIGLSNMMNRVESFNGSMDIDSAPGKGCKISFVIPY